VLFRSPPKDETGKEAPPPGAVAVRVGYQYGPPVEVTAVMPGSAAAAAGLCAGDLLLAIDGQPIRRLETLYQTVQAQHAPPPWWRRLSGGKEEPAAPGLTLKVQRGGEELTFANLVAKRQQVADLGLGWIIYNHPTPWQQLVDTVVMSYKSVRGIFANLLFGSSTLRARHLSGPIGIARGIFITAERGGMIPALSLVVMITFSLAILNLMPFPVLDGGHIVMALYERVFGKPLSAKLVQPLFSVFIVLLIALMVYVTYFDVLRMVPRSVTRDYWLRPVPAAAEAAAGKSEIPSPKSETGEAPAAPLPAEDPKP
jgi:regulator of sigma E protease